MRTKPSLIDDVQVNVYLIPTDQPETDGTLTWSSTTMVLTTIHCGGHTGLGYTYAHKAAASLIADPLKSCLVGHDPMNIPALWQAMNRSLRNIGRPGAGLMAIAALDHALWDLKARMLDVSVVTLLGASRDKVPIYGSGGFINYSDKKLRQQFSDYVKQGIRRVKMKIGADIEHDLARVAMARDVIGPDIALMVDANGAFDRRHASRAAHELARFDVDWFEEPVSSDDLAGLSWLRDHAPAPMQIAAGEYGWDDIYFARMLQAGAVDVLQIDSTRCGGFTGFLRAADVARSISVPISAHCSPHLHAHVGCALDSLLHIEYFHDHTRIESMFFDGLPALNDGYLVVDTKRPGHGMTLKEADAKNYLLNEQV